MESEGRSEDNERRYFDSEYKSEGTQQRNNSTTVSLYDRIYISAVFAWADYLLTVVRCGTGQIHHPIAVARLLQAHQVLPRPSGNSVSFQEGCHLCWNSETFHGG